jgi:hypothetical protein
MQCITEHSIEIITMKYNTSLCIDWIPNQKTEAFPHIEQMSLKVYALAGDVTTDLQERKKSECKCSESERIIPWL